MTYIIKRIPNLTGPVNISDVTLRRNRNKIAGKFKGYHGGCMSCCKCYDSNIFILSSRPKKREDKQIISRISSNNWCLAMFVHKPLTLVRYSEQREFDGILVVSNGSATIDVQSLILMALAGGLDTLATAIEEERLHQVLLQHDNACLHSANMTKAAIQELGCEVIPHPSYSFDLAPSDFHLFRSLPNSLQGNSYDNEEDVLQTWLDDFFNFKPTNFLRMESKNYPIVGRKS
ncbi:hypothetical protein ANN_18273 [Periplaneta americana]|uniref:Uncharacterized protein n=1 Tax=Periplaneta americana TaxID=6978 RepID=A0ABQ8SNA8_PERAM|nr:hypothetical protein ANN_18273 [Periplaneta americana]